MTNELISEKRKALEELYTAINVAQRKLASVHAATLGVAELQYLVTLSESLDSLDYVKSIDVSP
jgi:hypothetical protein